MNKSDNTVIGWLLEDDNPAVKYRTQTELLDESADKTPVVDWINGFIPADWKERKGLWATYYLNTFAECGLAFEDIGIDIEKAVGHAEDTPFDEGCGDFMRLRALVRLGLGNKPVVAEIIKNFQSDNCRMAGFYACTV